jgi:hypothetical protein
VTLKDVSVTGSEYRVVSDGADWEKMTTSFIGEGGKVLAKTYDRTAVYRLAGNEKYVRAKVESSSGAKAWTQPVFRR